MKKLVFSLFFILCITALFAQEQHLIAVTPFELIGGFDKNDADVIYELFVIELERSGEIKVVDHNTLNNADYIIQGQKMILSGRYVISARIVDTNTSKVLFDTPLQLNSLDELFGRLPVYVTSMVEILSQPQRVFSIGDIGPGGGTVFFAENGRYMEFSEEIGRLRWNDAVVAASNHRGGGFSDWYLPTRNELDLLYRSLRENRLGGISYDWYWSSTEITNESAWYRNFSGGRQGSANKTSPFRVMAIRVF